MTAQGEQRRAAVVGTGLIGGSVALALQAAGWHVTGSDIDPASAERALQTRLARRFVLAVWSLMLAA